MCGICGLLDLGAGPVAEDELGPMTDALRLRGPDDEGRWSDGLAALGQRRLSIIDVAGGRQPIANEDGSILTVGNGEIYNHLELRRELIERGHTFRTRTDTEVLVHGYETWGDDLVERLDGMFAFAIWDRTRRRLLLARDRFGKKPLLWFRSGGRFAFASTLTALLAHRDAPRRLDALALARYLAFEFVPAPQSMVDGISKLDAGEHLVVTTEGVTPARRYWSLNLARNGHPPRIEEAAERIRELLDAAVRKRLMSERPLGILLSGGIDSSSVVASAAAVGASPLRTFSIGFDEPSFDESASARSVARRFGAEHVEQTMTSREMLDVVPRLGEILDEPMADSSIVPTFLLCRLARAHVTVALGGDGGDELFCGYPTYQAHRIAEPLEAVVPRAVFGLASRVAAHLPVSHRNLSLDFKLKKSLEGMEYPRAIRNYVWLGAFRPDRLGEILEAPPDPTAVSDPIARAYTAGNESSHLERVLAQDARLYLPHEILCKVDRASMANSLEVRAPLLDQALAEYVASLPLGMKMKGLTTKVALRRAMASRLPPGVLARRKKGFGMPVGEWLGGPLLPLARELFAGLGGTGLFRRPALERLLDEHVRAAADHRKRIWALLTFELWRRHHRIAA